MCHRPPPWWCQCGPDVVVAAGGVDSSAALAIEKLVAAVSSAPPASRGPASTLRIDVMFVAPIRLRVNPSLHPMRTTAQHVSERTKDRAKFCERGTRKIVKN